jgi:hypothetical protein
LGKEVNKMCFNDRLFKAYRNNIRNQANGNLTLSAQQIENIARIQTLVADQARREGWTNERLIRVLLEVRARFTNPQTGIIK